MFARCPILAGLQAAPALSFGRARAQTRLRLAHVPQPTRAWQIAAEGFVREANERSGARLSVQVFPGAQLGQNQQLLESIQTGTIELALEDSSDLNSF